MAVKRLAAVAGIGVSVLCPGPVATGIVRRSAGLQPKAHESLSEEQESQVAERLERSSRWLQRDGVSIDDVGEMVLKAVRENSLYIHTDRLVEPLIKARTQALIDAMPG